MRNLLGFVLAASLLIAGISAAPADGARRSWRVYRPGIGAISQNVITPWYYGYHPTHYSYFAPDPMPPAATILLWDCWHWSFGSRYWACWESARRRVCKWPKPYAHCFKPGPMQGR
jgi:hypothetical protein